MFTPLLLLLISIYNHPINGVQDFKLEQWVSDPQTRSGGTMTAVGNDLYLIMGFEECFDFTIPGCSNTFYPSSEIWKYSTTSQEWDKINVNNPNESPSDRAFHTAALTDCETEACPEDSIVIYGGSYYQWLPDLPVSSGDFWYYNISGNEWVQILWDGVGPTNMSGQVILTKGDYVYSYGGIDDSFSVSDELWRYSFATNNWTLLEPEGDIPSARYLNRAVWIDEGREEFAVYAGNAIIGAGGADLWKYNVEDNEWTLLNDGVAPNVAPEGRTHGGFVAHPNENALYVFGGDSQIDEEECTTSNSFAAGQAISDETYKFNLATNEWRLLNVKTPRIKRFQYAQIDTTVYVFGGFNYFCDNPGSGQVDPDGHAIYNADTLKWEF